MKASETVRWIARLGLLALGLSAWSARGETATDREADHQALRALAVRVSEAIGGKDFKALRGCLAARFAFTTIDQTLLTSPEQIEAYRRRLFEGENALLRDLRITIRADAPTVFVADDVGYCTGTAVEEYVTYDGRAVTVNSRWTATLVREDGEWRIAAAHVGANFLDNPVLDRARGAIRRVAVITLVAGLLLGFLGGGWFLKKKGA